MVFPQSRATLGWAWRCFLGSFSKVLALEQHSMGADLLCNVMKCSSKGQEQLKQSPSIKVRNMNFIDQIVTHIVRPTRELYRIGKLGPRSFIVKSKLTSSIVTVNREDTSLLNALNQKIQISHYTITEKKDTPCPTVIYLHGNNGSRNEGIPYIRNILQMDMEVILLDFAGSGLSEGEFVTLGINEVRDVETVVNYLRNRSKDIFLWGRSMGAVVALIYVSRHQDKVKGVVVDSPFSSLRSLIKELASTKTGLPQFFFHAVLPFVDKELQSKAGVNMDDLEILRFVKNAKECPALFITSEDDEMVKSGHIEEIFKVYQGPKSIEYIKQQHHEIRSKETVDKIIDFLKRNCTSAHIITLKSPTRENYFDRLRPDRAEERAVKEKSEVKINPLLLESLNERVNPTMAYYQPPEKVSMAYLSKLKPQKDTYFYRDDSRNIDKGSTVRSYSSQYRISSASQASHTSRASGIQSRSVVKYMAPFEDSLSKSRTPRLFVRR